MVNDLEAGNRLELDWLAGKVVALGRKYGIPTPAQEAVYAILKLGRPPRYVVGAAPPAFEPFSARDRKFRRERV